jgi:hypothetical protein
VFGLALLVASSVTTFAGTQPQLASIGDHVYLTFARGDAISVVRSADAGATFGTPVPLPVTGKLSLGGHRGPRVAATSGAVLVSAVIGARGGGADGDIRLFRSMDRGQSWSAPIAINDVAGAAREGLHGMAATPAGLVVIAWLDLRQQGTRIYAALSRDHGATWGADMLVYASPAGSVCECCHPSVAVDVQGRIVIMFRNSRDGNRDMFVVGSSDGRSFSPAVKLGTGSWRLNACPMDGGGVALDGEDVVAAWRRDETVFLSTAGDPERRLGSGRDPAVALAGRHHDVVWSSPHGIMLARQGATPIVLGPGRSPALAALDGRTIVAWEEGDAIRLQSIPR